MSTDTIEKIIGAVVIVALLGFAFLFTWQGADSHVEALIATALGIVAFILKGPRGHAAPRKPRIPPGVQTLIMAFVAIAAAAMLGGCGAGMLGAQADLVAVGGIAEAEADAMLVRARATELDAIVDDARAECGDGSCSVDEADAYRARLRETEEHWAPVLACRAPVVEALRAWLDGLETAAAVETDTIGLELLVRLGLRFVQAYGSLVRCVETADPDVDLPGLPADLAAIGGAS